VSYAGCPDAIERETAPRQSSATSTDSIGSALTRYIIASISSADTRPSRTPFQRTLVNSAFQCAGARKSQSLPSKRRASSLVPGSTRTAADITSVSTTSSMGALPRLRARSHRWSYWRRADCVMR